MSKKSVCLLCLLIAVPVFLASAPCRPAAPISPFIPELAPLAPAPGTDAAGLLDEAIARLAPERITWLQVTLHQRMDTADIAFESEGSLRIGPNHCARLELEVRNGDATGRWLVVSDGHALAHVTRLGAGRPTVNSRLLVSATTEPGQTPAKPPNETLRELGCGGPYPLLRDLRGRLQDLSVQTGRIGEQPLVRIHGRLPPQPAADTGTAAVGQFCYVYLSAQTLWPSRVEWWTAGEPRGPRLFLEIEFRDPEVNRPLSLPECIQAFSYQPEPG